MNITVPRIQHILFLSSLFLPLLACTEQSLKSDGANHSWVELPYEIYEEQHGTDRHHPSLEIIKVSLTDNGRVIDVRFRLYGTSKIRTTPERTYVIDEVTGQKIAIQGKPRIGIFPPTKPKEGVPEAYLLLDNVNDTIKTGSVVTVVINSMYARHIVVR